MSRKTEILIVEPPLFMDREKEGETFDFDNHGCPRCNGNGGFYCGGYMEKFKNDYNDPDWEVCPVCKGTGIIKANVVLRWTPSGEVKEQFKNIENEK